MDSYPYLRNLNLDIEKYEVSVYAKEGLRTHGLQHLSPGMSGMHDICFIQIGGNDIGQLTNEKIIKNILSF